MYLLHSIKAHHLDIKTITTSRMSRFVGLGEASRSSLTIQLTRTAKDKIPCAHQPEEGLRSLHLPQAMVLTAKWITSHEDNDLFTFHWIKNWRYFIIGSGKICQMFHFTVFFWQSSRYNAEKGSSIKVSMKSSGTKFIKAWAVEDTFSVAARMWNFLMFLGFGGKLIGTTDLTYTQFSLSPPLFLLPFLLLQFPNRRISNPRIGKCIL